MLVNEGVAQVGGGASNARLLNHLSVLALLSHKQLLALVTQGLLLVGS